MPTIELTIDLFLLCGIVLLAAFAGFALRAGQLARKNRRINDLEKEMMKAYAEILDAQKESCEMESRLRDLTNPVITMKHPGKEEEPEDEQRPDASSLRKNRPTRTA